jgi:hypothetical protein
VADDEIDGKNNGEALIQDALAGAIVAASPGESPAAEIAPTPAEAESATAETSGAMATISDLRKSVTNDAIGAIEADIASLLATMGAVSDDAPATAALPAGDDDEDEIDAEDATLTLLGELDRMWRTDPMVGTSNAA